jgi:XTP/dITP diphosphohydrolase
VHSAHYAGKGGERAQRDARNNEKLVARLASAADRSAFYYCVLVLMRGPGDPSPIVADGTWHGQIVLEPRGGGGFGYDPYFRIGGRELTAAQLPAEEKNRVSHRGQALAALAARLAAEHPR